MKSIHCTIHGIFSKSVRSPKLPNEIFLSQNMSENKSMHRLERRGHILRVEPIVSPISMLEMFPEGLMLVWLTVLILFLLKDFSTRWTLQQIHIIQISRTLVIFF